MSNNNTPTYESRLRSVLEVVQAYLPPDGLSSKEAMARIVPLVDPWPEGAPDAANAGEPAALRQALEHIANAAMDITVERSTLAAAARRALSGVAADESTRAPDGQGGAA